MKKVAIVGVEGAGKTVMLAGLGELYSHPDKDGYFLEPKNLETASYVRRQYGILREGRWPSATAPDVMQVLGWTFRKIRGKLKPRRVCEVTCLDFAGEVYLAAFCGKSDVSLSSQVVELRNYMESATAIVLLVNLRDVIIRGAYEDRSTEIEFATLQMMKAIFEDRPFGARRQRVIVALSQVDAYRSTIDECGGARQTFGKYLPMVANSFGGRVDVIAINTVETCVTGSGDTMPCKDFPLTGLEPLARWIAHPPFSWRQAFANTVAFCYDIRYALLSISLVLLLFRLIFCAEATWLRILLWVLFGGVSSAVGVGQFSYADDLRVKGSPIASSVEKSGVLTFTAVVILIISRAVVWLVWD